MPFFRNVSLNGINITMSQSSKNKTQKTNSSTLVLVEEIEAGKGKLGLLTLNSEKTLNSITLEMVHSLTANLKKVGRR